MYEATQSYCCMGVKENTHVFIRVDKKNVTKYVSDPRPTFKFQNVYSSYFSGNFSRQQLQADTQLL